MAAKDGRRNALVKGQRWIELGYIDNISMEAYIEFCTKDKEDTVYGFCGQSTQCAIRIDWRSKTNANLRGDFFSLLDQIRDNSVSVFVLDPPFELYNPSLRLWKSLIKKGLMPKSAEDTKYFGHPHLWQAEAFKKVKPGGMMITKRNIANTNVLSKIPQMWYVHDARPMAHIVRLDRK